MKHSGRIGGALTSARRRHARYRYLFALPLFCCAGATALEYAVLIPILLLLLLGIVEYSLIMYASAVLEGATTTAARAGKTGYPDPTSETTRQSYVYNLLDQQASGLLDPSKITVTATAYDNFAEIGQSSQGTPGVGQANQIVVYTTSYPWPVATPMLQALLDGGDGTGTFTVTSTAIVKNEPFAPTTLSPTPAPGPGSTPSPTPTPAPTCPPPDYSSCPYGGSQNPAPDCSVVCSPAPSCQPGTFCVGGEQWTIAGDCTQSWDGVSLCPPPPPATCTASSFTAPCGSGGTTPGPGSITYTTNADCSVSISSTCPAPTPAPACAPPDYSSCAFGGTQNPYPDCGIVCFNPSPAPTPSPTSGGCHVGC